MLSSRIELRSRPVLFIYELFSNNSLILIKGSNWMGRVGFERDGSDGLGSGDAGWIGFIVLNEIRSHQIKLWWDQFIY
jgi:hypothetical protein